MMELPGQNESGNKIKSCVPTQRWSVGRIAVFVVVALLVACSEPATPPEESLRQWVKRGQQAAEDKDRQAIVAMISPAYADGRGNNRDDIGNLLRIYFLRMNNVALITQIEELNVIADTAAELVVTVGMAGTHDGTLGFSADAYRFELELEANDDDWLLLGARWGELGAELR